MDMGFESNYNLIQFKFHTFIVNVLFFKKIHPIWISFIHFYGKYSYEYIMKYDIKHVIKNQTQ